MKYVLIVLLFIAGCGRHEISVEPDIIPPNPDVSPIEATATIAVFGAAWCPYCSKYLPQVQAELLKRPAAVQKRVKLELYVPTGERQTDPATQAAADRYKAKIGLSQATAIADLKWQKFAALVGGDRVIPAGAVIKDGKVKPYRAGTAFDPAEIVEFAARGF
jgi:thiol-disulfide isomerase/thioredoxin